MDHSGGLSAQDVMTALSMMLQFLILPVIGLLFNLSNKLAKLEGQFVGMKEGLDATSRLVENTIRAALSTPNERTLALEMDRRRTARENN